MFGDPMNFILPGLYLGDMCAAGNLELLQENKITHILVVGLELDTIYPETFSYHHIEIDDAKHEDIISHFHASINFIEEAMKTGNVFVHCAAGISRSSTIVIAYLMHKNKWDFETAYTFAREKRDVISPNTSFQRQLELFHKLEYKVDPEHPEMKTLKEILLAKKIKYPKEDYWLEEEEYENI